MVTIIHDIKCLNNEHRCYLKKIAMNIKCTNTYSRFNNTINWDRILIPKALSANFDVKTIKDDRYN